MMGLKSWIPSIIVVLGWAIVYQIQALQVRRKILREEIEKTRDVIIELGKTAARFHMNPYSVEDHMSITSLLTDIERRYSMFPKIAKARRRFLPNAVEVGKIEVDPKHLVGLRQAITGTHFDDSAALALPHSDSQFKDISSATRQMILVIDGVFVAALD
ncbi:hypothetical protein D5039_00145 [Verminephrobacter aporrectodeae subsp. tuberculatae]|uniref:Uncharacterized protein n=2 Tax=Verminephrobacter TaxID=364316 RepID=A0ABT3KMZ0_9BURK|nr:hypothetical protein [Verminephrobacter aporrectodeae subsp. tuberculatae]